MNKRLRAGAIRLYFLVGVVVGFLGSVAPAQPVADSPTQPTNAPVATNDDVVAKSVVQVNATLRYPDSFQPWSKKPPVPAATTGIVIEGKRILTTAHAVAYSTDIQIVTDEAGDKVSASIEALSPEVDLAVLKLEDESFFQTHPALARSSKLPQLKDEARIYGFPKGGTGLSYTNAAVASVDYASYNGANGLRLQLDAGINPGMSGGPAVIGNSMIGLAFLPPNSSPKMSFVIPCDEIELFLIGIRSGSYHGRPNFDVQLQELKHPALRDFLGLAKSVHGVVVQQVGPGQAGSPLQKWDVITQVGTNDLDDSGMVKLSNESHVAFTYFFLSSAANGAVPLTVVRSGQTLHLEVPLQPYRPRLLLGLNGAYPDYFVYGPLVFSDASQDMLFDMATSIANGRSPQGGILRLLDQETPLTTRFGDFPKFEGERLVVVTAVFPHKLTQDYGNPTGQVVKAVNGVPIKNLAHLVQVLRDLKDKNVTFDFFGRYSSSLVFPQEEMLAATEGILSDNGVHSQGSPDVMAIWSAK